MTCTSLKSGMASSGVCCRATNPPTMAKKVTRRIKKRWCALKAMSCAIIPCLPSAGSSKFMRVVIPRHASAWPRLDPRCAADTCAHRHPLVLHALHPAHRGLQLTLRIKQKLCRCDNVLIFLEPLQHFHPVSSADAKLHRAPFEPALPQVEKDELPLA